MIDESLRSRIVNRANAVVGLSAAPAHLEQFSDFLGGPGEAKATSHAMATAPNSSTCGLVCRALQRDAEVKDPHVHAPYRISMAISDLLSFAQAHGAWVTAKPGLRPQPGDMVGLALFGADAGHHGHVYTVVSDTAGLVSVDGGQVDKAGRQMIARKHRTWVERGAKIFDSSRLEDPSSGFDSYDEREVSGWVDVSKLPVEDAEAVYGP